jgi:hypothetical protein
MGRAASFKAVTKVTSSRGTAWEAAFGSKMAATMRSSCGGLVNTFFAAVRRIKAPRWHYIVALGIMTTASAVSTAADKQAGKPAELSTLTAQNAHVDSEVGRVHAPVALGPKAGAGIQKQGVMDLSPAGNDDPDVAPERKLSRISSIAITAEHPGETANQIAAIAEKMGGYLWSSNGGQDVATADVAIADVAVRVPVEHFEETRTQIRKLALRVQRDDFIVHDVTWQYAGLATSIRNLQAEESQYLEILKRADSVNNMMIVTQKLDEVRSGIATAEAAFSPLEQQAETVLISVSLGKDNDRRAVGSGWHRLPELQLAASNGLESVATYATVMMTILFYLPAMLLWVGTIAGAVVGGRRTLYWAGRRWFGWRRTDAQVQPNPAA